MIVLDTYTLIILFALTIIVSYFFNLYSKKSGVPSVLMLIGLGIIINLLFSVFSINPPNLNSSLQFLGVIGLILIVLEAALDLKILKEKFGVIFKSFLVSVLALFLTSCISAYFLNFLISDLVFVECLLYTIPLSILSSAIILPSLDLLSDSRKEFMVYESTFSDIVGIVGFYAVLGFVGSSDPEGVLPKTFLSLFTTILLSVAISYVLIYVFQNIRSHGKLFLLIAVLLLLYSIGKLFHLSSLIMIMIFGVILNNYKMFFGGSLRDFIIEDRVENVLSSFKLITVESAFVVRTFFFLIFGLTISLSSLLNIKSLLYGVVLIAIIYLVRALVLLFFNRSFSIKSISPELFLAPRGLITILLFFSIPESISPSSVNFDGILLFVILASCLIMSWGLIKEKRRVEEREAEDFEVINPERDLEKTDSI